jgi:hypothetical protein
MTVAVALCVIVMGAHVMRVGGGLTALVGFGETHPHALWEDPRVPPGTVVQRGEIGYDGQSYFVLSLRPFTEDSPVPIPRRQRILYPFLAWLISFGRPEVAAASLALVNLIAIALGTALLALWMRERGLSPAWSVLGVASAGGLLSCQYLCPDALLVALLVAAVWAIDRRQWPLAALALAAACLTKEPALVAWFAVAVGVLITRPGGGALLTLLAPVPWLLWVIALHEQTGEWVIGWSLTQTQSLPGSGWLGALTDPLRDLSTIRVSLGPSLLALLLAVGLILAVRSRGGPRQMIAGMMILWGIAGLFWIDAIWGHFVAIARNMAPLTLFTVMLAAPRGRLARGLVALLALLAMAMVLARAVALGSVPETFLTQ